MSWQYNYPCNIGNPPYHRSDSGPVDHERNYQNSQYHRESFGDSGRTNYHQYYREDLQQGGYNNYNNSGSYTQRYPYGSSRQASVVVSDRVPSYASLAESSSGSSTSRYHNLHQPYRDYENNGYTRDHDRDRSGSSSRSSSRTRRSRDSRDGNNRRASSSSRKSQSSHTDRPSPSSSKGDEDSVTKNKNNKETTNNETQVIADGSTSLKHFLHHAEVWYTFLAGNGINTLDDLKDKLDTSRSSPIVKALVHSKKVSLEKAQSDLERIKLYIMMNASKRIEENHQDVISGKIPKSEEQNSTPTDNVNSVPAGGGATATSLTEEKPSERNVSQQASQNDLQNLNIIVSSVKSNANIKLASPKNNDLQRNEPSEEITDNSSPPSSGNTLEIINQDNYERVKLSGIIPEIWVNFLSKHHIHTVANLQEADISISSVLVSSLADEKKVSIEDATKDLYKLNRFVDRKLKTEKKDTTTTSSIVTASNKRNNNSPVPIVRNSEKNNKKKSSRCDIQLANLLPDAKWVEFLAKHNVHTLAELEKVDKSITSPIVKALNEIHQTTINLAKQELDQWVFIANEILKGKAKQGADNTADNNRRMNNTFQVSSSPLGKEKAFSIGPPVQANNRITAIVPINNGKEKAFSVGPPVQANSTVIVPINNDREKASSVRPPVQANNISTAIVPFKNGKKLSDLKLPIEWIKFLSKHNIHTAESLEEVDVSLDSKLVKELSKSENMTENLAKQEIEQWKIAVRFELEDRNNRNNENDDNALLSSQRLAGVDTCSNEADGDCTSGGLEEEETGSQGSDDSGKKKLSELGLPTEWIDFLSGQRIYTVEELERVDASNNGSSLVTELSKSRNMLESVAIQEIDLWKRAVRHELNKCDIYNYCEDDEDDSSEDEEDNFLESSHSEYDESDTPDITEEEEEDEDELESVSVTGDENSNNSCDVPVELSLVTQGQSSGNDDDDTNNENTSSELVVYREEADIAISEPMFPFWLSLLLRQFSIFTLKQFASLSEEELMLMTETLSKQTPNPNLHTDRQFTLLDMFRHKAILEYSRLQQERSSTNIVPVANSNNSNFRSTTSPQIAHEHLNNSDIREEHTGPQISTQVNNNSVIDQSLTLQQISTTSSRTAPEQISTQVNNNSVIDQSLTLQQISTASSRTAPEQISTQVNNNSVIDQSFRAQQISTASSRTAPEQNSTQVNNNSVVDQSLRAQQISTASSQTAPEQIPTQVNNNSVVDQSLRAQQISTASSQTAPEQNSTTDNLHDKTKEFAPNVSKTTKTPVVAATKSISHDTTTNPTKKKVLVSSNKKKRKVILSKKVSPPKKSSTNTSKPKLKEKKSQSSSSRDGSSQIISDKSKKSSAASNVRTESSKAVNNRSSSTVSSQTLNKDEKIPENHNFEMTVEKSLHRKEYCEDGYPVEHLTLIHKDDSLDHFMITIENSTVCPSKGAFLTYLGREELKPEVDRIPLNEFDAQIPMEASHKGKHILVHVNGSGIHEESGRDGKKISGRYSRSDYRQVENKSFSCEREGYGLIPLGSYGPLRNKDLKEENKFDLKNFIYNDEPKVYSFGVGGGNSKLMCDVTDDSTGTPHDEARKRIPMYVNEVGYRDDLVKNVFPMSRGKSILYYGFIRSALKKGDKVELLTDYGEIYEEVREREGYGRKNLNNDNFRSWLDRELYERQAIKNDILELDPCGAREWIDFLVSTIHKSLIHHFDEFVPSLIAQQGSSDELMLEPPSATQIIAKWRIKWLFQLFKKRLPDLTTGLNRRYMRKSIFDMHEAKLDKFDLPQPFLKLEINDNKKQKKTIKFILQKEISSELLFDSSEALPILLGQSKQCNFSYRIMKKALEFVSDYLLESNDQLKPIDEVRNLQIKLWTNMKKKISSSLNKLKGLNKYIIQNNRYDHSNMKNFSFTIPDDSELDNDIVKKYCGDNDSSPSTIAELKRVDILKTPLHLSYVLSEKLSLDDNNNKGDTLSKHSSEEIQRKFQESATEEVFVVEASGGSKASMIKSLNSPNQNQCLDYKWYLLYQVLPVVHSLLSAPGISWLSDVESGNDIYSLKELCLVLEIGEKQAESVLREMKKHATSLNQYSKGMSNNKVKTKKSKRKRKRKENTESVHLKPAAQQQENRTKKRKISNDDNNVQPNNNKNNKKKKQAPTGNKSRGRLFNLLFHGYVWPNLEKKVEWTLVYGTRKGDRYYLPKGVQRGMGFRPRTDFFDSIIQVVDALHKDARWCNKKEVIEIMKKFDSANEFVRNELSKEEYKSMNNDTTYRKKLKVAV